MGGPVHVAPFLSNFLVKKKYCGNEDLGLAWNRIKVH